MASFFLLQDLNFAHTIDSQSNQTNKGDPMKHLYKSTAVLLLLLPISMMSSAAEPQKTDEPMKEMGMHQGMGMGMMGGMTEEQKTEKMRSMQEHMLKMHDLSNQILTEKDAAKKEALKKQQLELMKAHHAQMMEHRQQRMQEHK
jgi:hypothetical protein